MIGEMTVKVFPFPCEQRTGQTQPVEVSTGAQLYTPGGPRALIFLGPHARVLLHIHRTFLHSQKNLRSDQICTIVAQLRARKPA